MNAFCCEMGMWSSEKCGTLQVLGYEGGGGSLYCQQYFRGSYLYHFGEGEYVKCLLPASFKAQFSVASATVELNV